MSIRKASLFLLLTSIAASAWAGQSDADMSTLLRQADRRADKEFIERYFTYHNDDPQVERVCNGKGLDLKVIQAAECIQIGNQLIAGFAAERERAQAKALIEKAAIEREKQEDERIASEAEAQKSRAAERDKQILAGKVQPETARDFTVLNKAESGLCSVWMPSPDDAGKTYLIAGMVELITSKSASVGKLAMAKRADVEMQALAALSCGSQSGQMYFKMRMLPSTKVEHGYRHAVGGNVTVVARHAGLGTYETVIGQQKNIPVLDVLFIGAQSR